MNKGHSICIQETLSLESHEQVKKLLTLKATIWNINHQG